MLTFVSGGKLPVNMDVVIPSLKEQCISVICDNFERYFSAFKVSSGSHLAKHFEFLERAFSEMLFDNLKKSFKLKAEYFDLLINRHIRHLNLEDVDEELIPALLDRLEAIQNNIVSIRAGFYRIELNHYKKLISSVPNVEVMEISEDVYPEVLEEIGKRCSSLRVLKLLHCEVEDCGLMNIFRNVNGEYEDKVCLHHLDIDSPFVSDQAISFVLSHAPSLKSLGYRDTARVIYEKHKQDQQNGCLESVKKYLLTSLIFPIIQEDITDTMKICIALCPSVSSLTVDCLESDEQLLLCSKFRSVKDIKISANQDVFTFDGITQFLKLKGSDLFSIQLDGGCMSAEALVEYCPNLRTLKLNTVQYKPVDQNKSLMFHGRLPNLKTVSLIRSNFSDKEVAESVMLILSNGQCAKTLNFSGCSGLTQKFVTNVLDLSLSNLQEVILNRSDITIPAAAEFLTHCCLKKLSVANCANIKMPEFYELLEIKGNTAVTWSDYEYDSTSSDDPEDYSPPDDDDDFFDYDFYDYDDFDDYDDHGYYDFFGYPDHDQHDIDDYDLHDEF